MKLHGLTAVEFHFELIFDLSDSILSILSLYRLSFPNFKFDDTPRRILDDICLKFEDRSKPY